jgi:hypothetical protein
MIEVILVLSAIIGVITALAITAYFVTFQIARAWYKGKHQAEEEITSFEVK